MTNNLIQIKVKQRLNKLASLDYDNIESWQIAEAFNKAQLEWMRRVLHGLTPRALQPEQSTSIVDDLQNFLVQDGLGGRHRDTYFESSAVPVNYLHFVRVSARGITDCCPSRVLSVYLAEEANADELLSDNFKSPSFEWAETFCTIVGNKIRIYTNGDFTIEGPSLTYYRKPAMVKFKDSIDIDTGEIVKYDVTCEFKDDVIEILCDETAAILAGDIMDITQYQRDTQNAARNS